MIYRCFMGDGLPKVGYKQIIMGDPWATHGRPRVIHERLPGGSQATDGLV